MGYQREKEREKEEALDCRGGDDDESEGNDGDGEIQSEVERLAASLDATHDNSTSPIKYTNNERIYTFKFKQFAMRWRSAVNLEFWKVREMIDFFPFFFLILFYTELELGVLKKKVILLGEFYCHKF